jgi:thiamine kinase-like enzyme
MAERQCSESVGATLVHNDYKFDNVMLNPENLSEIVAVLDWEMATLGEPLMDLGTTLGYWMAKESGTELLSMPFNPRVLMENVSRQELVAMYAEKSGAMFRTYFFITFSARSKSLPSPSKFISASSKVLQKTSALRISIVSSTARQNCRQCFGYRKNLERI